MQIGLKQISILHQLDARTRKRKRRLALFIFLALFSFMMCLRTTKIGFVPPLDALSNLSAWVQLRVAEYLHLPLYERRNEFIMAHPYYFETVGRFTGLLLVMAMGAALSLAGAVFQNVFRNPIAVPTMLGVSSGIQLGNLILILKFSLAASSMLMERYIYSYALCIILLFLILFTGRFMSNRKSSVTDMLLAGSIIVRLISNVIAMYQDSYMSVEEYLLYQEMSLYGTGISPGLPTLVLVIAMLLGLLPLYFMRFSLNAISFEDEDAKAMGINPGAMRLIALVSSTFLITAALIHCGNISMLSLLIPHASRYIFGANFKDLYFSCAVYGAIIMMVCKLITYLFSFHPYLEVISMGIIVELVAAPVLIILLIRQKRGWE